jgi:hypothetical protein
VTNERMEMIHADQLSNLGCKLEHCRGHHVFILVKSVPFFARVDLNI